MKFQEGNNLWELCQHPGAPRKYNTPKKLKEVVIAYFEWALEHPIEVEKTGFFKGNAITYVEKAPRPLTIRECALFAKLTHETWIQLRRTRPDLSEVISWAEDIIWNQKFQHAAVGVFKGNIISQELGLKQKIEHSQTGGTLEEFLDGLEEDNEPEEWASV